MNTMRVGTGSEPEGEGGRAMRSLKISALSAAILLVAAGIGLEIAQAEGTHSDRPVLSFEDQEASEGGSSHCPYDEGRPVLSFEEQENLSTESKIAGSGESRPVLSFEDAEAVQVAMLKQRDESCKHQ